MLKKVFFFGVLAGLFVTSYSIVLSKDIILVTDFSKPVYMTLFNRSPSWGKFEIVSDACKFTYNKTSGGWVGLNLNFFRNPINAWHLKSLCVSVKGQKGGEDVRIGLKDATRGEDESAVFAGNLSNYLPKGQITQNWQEVIIPFKDFPNVSGRTPIDFSDLTSIIFQRFDTGEGIIYIDNIAFTDRESPTIDYYKPQCYLKVDFDNLRPIHRMFTYLKTDSLDKVDPSPDIPLERIQGYRGRGIRFSYNHPNGFVNPEGRWIGGFVGVWIWLNKPFDVSRANSLSFYVKGEGDFIVGLNDEKEGTIGEHDFYTTKSVTQYLGVSITQRWQRVKIPLSDFNSIIEYDSKIDIEFYYDPEMGKTEQRKKMLHSNRIQKIAFRITSISPTEDLQSVWIDEIEIR